MHILPSRHGSFGKASVLSHIVRQWYAQFQTRAPLLLVDLYVQVDQEHLSHYAGQEVSRCCIRGESKEHNACR